MKVSTQLVITLALGGAASAAGLSVLIFFDPGQASIALLTVLYVTLFVWIYSIFVIAGYYLRLGLWKSGVKYELWRSARRQAVLLGFLSIVLLLLKRAAIFNPMTAVLLMLIFVLTELYAGQ